MKCYLDLMQDILDNGVVKADRTRTGTLSVFGRQLRFDLSAGFPLLTTKRLHVRSIIYELLWFLKGETNIKFLVEHHVHIWDAWANEQGELGPIYGYQWRSWPTRSGQSIDQLSEIITQINHNPDSRRLIVSAWNVEDIDKMALPPCHLLFQFYVAQGRLSCLVIQRSADLFIGVPFNIASYALLTHLIAQQCQLAVGELVWTGGDVHIYLNHLESVKLQLTRTPYPLPSLIIKRQPNSLFDYQFADFEIVNYRAHQHIKATVAV
ncbi:MAG: thymidylate synthase [Thioploca sp.]|nr:thymidylate synthase [Thioploca sp.]